MTKSEINIKLLEFAFEICKYNVGNLNVVEIQVLIDVAEKLKNFCMNKPK